jgi:subtilisin family serine protease
MNWLRIIIGTALLAVCAIATAQPGLPGVSLPKIPGLEGPSGTLRDARPPPRVEPRKRRIRELLRTERHRWEADPDGQPILRDQVGALSPTPAALARARAAGFRILSEQTLPGLGLTLVVLAVPEGLSTHRALRRLREIDPEGSYDYNHLYLDSGVLFDASGAAPPVAAEPVSAEAIASADPVRIGLIDSGVDGAHPALVDARIYRFGCNGAILPGAHGTAVASLLVGRAEDFRGVMPDAELYAADVFCGEPGGSLAALAVALDWMAGEQIPVVNISLVGAQSVLLTGLVQALAQRGHLLVAAVGNDGPAAAPLYPAAYPEVVGVTGVDARQRVLPEAGRGPQVAFAALGADLRAAQTGGGWSEVRGTSFATPIVVGLLAGLLREPDPVRMRAALDELAATAVDLGSRGVDPVYGQGLVGISLGIAMEAGPSAEKM